MAAVWARARAELRSGWRRGIGLALLIGLIAGAALAAAAGARRTDSALERFNRDQRAADALLLDDGEAPVKAPPPDDIAKLPNVVATARGLYAYMLANQGAASPADAALGRDVNRLKVLDGRLPRPDRADEVAVAFDAAKREQLRLGSTFPIIETDQPESAAFVKEHPEAQMTMRVVGIVAGPGELPPQPPGLTAVIHGTPALYRFFRANEDLVATSAHRAEQVTPDSTWVRLAHGQADLPAFRRALRTATGVEPFVTTPQVLDANSRNSIHLQAQALWLLTALLALVAAVVFGQLLSRFIAVETVDGSRLRALGMTSRQVLAVTLARLAVLAAVGALVAVLVAVCLSPLTPIGLARTIEVRPGVRIDPRALLTGAAIVIALVLVISLYPAWRASRTRGWGVEESAPRERMSMVAQALARNGFSPAVVAGTRMALEPGRGRAAVPVRSTLVGGALAVAALAAALTFGTSLRTLLDTPRLYGSTWDTRLTNYGSTGDKGGDPDLAKHLVAVSRVPGVAAASPAVFGQLDVGGRSTGLLAVTGDIRPTILAGRYPTSPDDIALGAKTIKRLRARIGSEVTVTGLGGQAVRFHLVGKTILSGNADPRLGEGALISMGAMSRIVEGSPVPDSGADSVLVRFRPGADRAAVVADLQRILGPYSGGGVLDVLPPDKPTDIVNFGGVQGLPFVLAAILAVLAIATLGHLLSSAVRNRRRDLAILKTLGFSRGQVTGAVLWQGTILAAVSLLIGVPLGVGVGRWLWTFFATQQGVVVEPRIPVPAILLVIPAAIAVAGLVAAVPARVASLIKPALALRTE